MLGDIEPYAHSKGNTRLPDHRIVMRPRGSPTDAQIKRATFASTSDFYDAALPPAGVPKDFPSRQKNHRVFGKLNFAQTRARERIH